MFYKWLAKTIKLTDLYKVVEIKILNNAENIINSILRMNNDTIYVVNFNKFYTHIIINSINTLS